MRRKILPCLLFLFFLLPLTGRTQTHPLISNTFLSLSAGPNVYFNTHGTSVLGGASLSGGKWILSTAGMRVQLSAQMASTELSTQLYYYGHCDIFFDLLTAFRGRNPSDRFRSYLAVGVGIVHSASGDNDFCGIASIAADYKLGGNWRLSAELGAFVHPSDFDNNNRSSLMGSLQFGAIYDIADNPTRSRSRYETQQLSNDWFFQLAFGISSFNYSGVGDLSDRIGLLTPIFEFAFGKRLTSRWLIRLGLSGLYTRSADEIFSYYSLHGDVMLDVMGLLYPDKIYTTFNVRPYVSAGIVSRLDDQSHYLFSPAGGVQWCYSFNQRNELFLDTRYLITPPRFAHVGSSQGTLSVGIATITLGYNYKFGRISFR